MANLKKSWFLSPTWDIPPSAIRLGHLITEATEPRYPINPTVINTSESSSTDTPPTIDTETFNDTSSQLSIEISGDSSTRLGLWGQFLQVVGLSAEAKLTLSKGALSKYAFEEMQTQWFNPSLTYVSAMVKTKSVRDFLEIAGTKKPLYIVTGIKSVTGASLSTTNFSGHTYGAKLGVDGTAAGAPMMAGPEFERNISEGLSVSWSKKGPLVFAYQVMKVDLRKETPRTNVYTKGAMFQAGDTVEDVFLEVGLLDELSESDLGHVKAGKTKKKTGKTFQAVRSFEEGCGGECTIIVPCTI